MSEERNIGARHVGPTTQKAVINAYSLGSLHLEEPYWKDIGVERNIILKRILKILIGRM
jgi:hypothetical protein